MLKSSETLDASKVEGSVRSPLRAPPRRRAGESQFLYVLKELVLRYVVMFCFALGATFIVLVELVFSMLPIPVPWFTRLILMLGLWVGVVIMWFVVQPKILAARRGIAGEAVVADGLQRLIVDGYQSIHDIPWDSHTNGQPPTRVEKRPSWLLRFFTCGLVEIEPPEPNIDHVVVGPAGVFAIETKYRSKPPSGDVKISFDGKALKFNGQSATDEPIRQARACADDVRRFLKATTGKNYPVRPVVLYPGWFVLENERSFVEEARRPGGVWVLNPDRLRYYLKSEEMAANRQSPRLSEAEISNAVDRLLRRGNQSD